MTVRELTSAIYKALREQKVPFVVVLPITRETLARDPDIATKAAHLAGRRMRRLIEDRRLFGENANHIDEA